MSNRSPMSFDSQSPLSSEPGAWRGDWRMAEEADREWRMEKLILEAERRAEEELCWLMETEADEYGVKSKYEPGRQSDGRLFPGGCRP